MKRIFSIAVLGVAVAATTLSTIPAQADHWRRHYHRHHDRGDALAAGIAGLAIGAIVGGALSQPTYRSYPNRVYIDPPVRPRYVYRGPVTYSSLEPWSPAWYEACDARYKTFDAQSGTFMGYDGRRHFCDFN